MSNPKSNVHGINYHTSLKETGLVHLKMEILFAHPGVIPNICAFMFSINEEGIKICKKNSKQ